MARTAEIAHQGPLASVRPGLRILSLIGFWAVLMTGVAGAQELDPAPTARQAADAMGMGFNLGQMFDNTQHPPTLETAAPKIDAYYDRGFRVVRIPVTWTEPVGLDTLADPVTGRVDRDAARLVELQGVVDYALTKPGLFVVLNAHHERRLKDSQSAEVLGALWSDIQDIFGDRDPRLMFELLNEPHLGNDDPMPAAALRAMTAQAYRAIRTRDRDRIILIGGNQWFGAREMALTWPNLEAVGGGKDAYLMATFHHYDPWTFSGQDQGDFADDWTQQNLREPMQLMADWASTVGGGMPVFIGEWGVAWQSRMASMDCNNIRLWYQALHDRHAKEMNMPTAVWDDGGWFGLFDHTTGTFSSNLVDCIDGTCDWTGADRFGPDC